MSAPCEACEGEGSWFRHLDDEGLDILKVTCNVCDGTGRDQFGACGEVGCEEQRPHSHGLPPEMLQPPSNKDTRGGGGMTPKSVVSGRTPQDEAVS